MPLASSSVGLPPLILASASRARRDMLTAAGLVFDVLAAEVDEAALKDSLKAEKVEATEAALALSDLKGLRVSRQRPDALVLASDQMLTCQGRWFDKPRNREEARTHLQALRGRSHTLITAAVLLRESRRVWQTVSQAKLTMRNFSDAFLEDYLDQAGDKVLESVGCYQLEGLGCHLFSAIEGDIFTIMGLPLLPVLEQLRNWKMVSA